MRNKLQDARQVFVARVFTCSARGLFGSVLTIFLLEIMNVFFNVERSRRERKETIVRKILALPVVVH